MARSDLDLRTLQPNRVCLIKPSSLGDVVHALPVLASLRELWPDAHISWVVNRGLRGLIDGHPALDEVIPFDRSKVGLGPRGLIAFMKFAADLRRRKFDVTIDLQGLLRSGIMAAATGAPIRVGLAEAREGASRFYTHRIAMPTSPTHAIDKMLRVANAFGGSSVAQFHVPISSVHREWAKREIGFLRRPILVVNVGARWLTKRWPAASFAEVARRAVHENHAEIIAVGAPEDRSLVDGLIEALAPIPVLDYCGKTSLPQLAALFSLADCVLSNDTGPLHLAAAVGARVVGVYTCTSPEKTGPYGANALHVSSRIWCAASCIKTCGRMDCMTELRPDRVSNAVKTQLASSLIEDRSSVA